MSLTMQARCYLGRGVASGGTSTYAAAIKRYDGGSGAAWFRGAIPLAPGAVTSSGGLSGLVVKVNGTEPASGLYLTLLDGRHSDDSYRSVFVEFQATVNDATAVSCTVQLTGGTRSVGDRSAAQDSVELTNRAWQLAPTLFGITDPAYLCAAQVAPLPLVPLTSLPSGLQTYLTTYLDTCNAVNTSGASTYDENYPLMCRYLCTGSLDDLSQGVRRNASNNQSGELATNCEFSYFLCDPTANFTPLDLNPGNYATTNPTLGQPAEWHDNTLGMYLCYQLTGWTQAKLQIFKSAITTGVDLSFSDFFETATLDPNGNSRGYFRQNFRWGFQPGVIAHILRLNQEIVTNNSIFTYKETGDPNGTASRTMAQRIQRRVDRLETYAATVSGPAWWTNLWGCGNTNINDTVPDRTRNFQFITGLSLAMAYLNGADTRSKIPTQLDAIASWVWSQQTNNSVAWDGYGIYGTPYTARDPAALPTVGNGYYTTVLAPLYAWAYARDHTQTTKRDRVDYVMDERHWSYTGDEVTLGDQPASDRKVMGEAFYMAFHGAAWRAGVAWNGWTL